MAARRSNSKHESRKPMKTFVYDDKRRDRVRKVDAMIKAMEEIARQTDAAIARARKSEEELRELLDMA